MDPIIVITFKFLLAKITRISEPSKELAEKLRKHDNRCLIPSLGKESNTCPANLYKNELFGRDKITPAK
jgi:hypothetical protein